MSNERERLPSFEYRTERDLPCGWAYAPLESLGRWGTGNTPSKANTAYWERGTLPWVSPKDMKVSYLSDAIDHVTERAVEEGGAAVVPPGTIFFVVRGMILAHTFPVAMTTVRVAFNQDMRSLVPYTEAIFPPYLLRALQQEAPAILGVVREATHGTLRLESDNLLSWPIPIAPLPEQHRIVAAVEALLEKVARAKARLDRVAAILKRFRQAVLAAACSGELTREWRSSSGGATAQDWVKSIYNDRAHGVRSRRRLELSEPAPQHLEEPSGWCEARIGDISESLDSLRKPINREERTSRQGTVPYFGANGQVGWIDTHLFDENLVLVVEDETFVGREKPFSYVIRGKSWVNNHAHVLRPLGGMSAEYLNVCLSYYDFVPLTSGTTGRRKLTKSALMEATLRIAPPPEQVEIVRRVGLLFSIADTIEKRVEVARTRAEKLPQAILSKAFSGELVPTEAELARAEGRAYESAEELLRRVGGQSTEAPKAPRKRKQAAERKDPTPAATSPLRAEVELKEERPGNSSPSVPPPAQPRKGGATLHSLPPGAQATLPGLEPEDTPEVTTVGAALQERLAKGAAARLGLAPPVLSALLACKVEVVPNNPRATAKALSAAIPALGLPLARRVADELAFSGGETTPAHTLKAARERPA